MEIAENPIMTWANKESIVKKMAATTTNESNRKKDEVAKKSLKRDLIGFEIELKIDCERDWRSADDAIHF